MTAPTSKQGLLACLNETNGRNVPMEELIFSLPEPGTLNGYNTVVVVAAAPGSGRVGSGPYHYNRLDLAMLAVEDDIHFPEPTGNTVGDLVEILNQIHRLGMTADDIANWDEVIPDLSAGAVSATLVAEEHSFAWYGTLTIQLSEGAPTLLNIDEVVIVHELDGFFLPHLQAME